MKKISFLFCAVSIVLSVNQVNAMPTFDGSFLGINTAKDHCRMQTEDGSFTYMGGAKTKLTMNNNYVISSCKAEHELGDKIEEAMVEREDIPCRIAMENSMGMEKPMGTEGSMGNGKPKMIHYEGVGGFTVTPAGNVAGHCKAEK